MKARGVMCLTIGLCGFALVGCKDSETSSGSTGNVREDMRLFVQAIGSYARSSDADFLLIPQNGHDVITEESDPTETPNATYLAAIDGLGREDLLYGYESDNVATDSAVTAEIQEFLDIYEANGVQVLVTDYINTTGGIADSYAVNEASGYISFAADSRELDSVPADPSASAPNNYSTGTDVTTLAGAANFLYVLNPSGFASTSAYLSALAASNHDMLIIDAFDGDDVALTMAQVTALKTKADGASRLVISYMSIGEAEDNRYYWQSSWNTSPPGWLDEENANFAGNYKVQYWDADWQSIIYGNDSSYLKIILDAGFDGVYLDIIDGFEFFEAQGL